VPADAAKAGKLPAGLRVFVLARHGLLSVRQVIGRDAAGHQVAVKDFEP
jgi:hypothetical protein